MFKFLNVSCFLGFLTSTLLLFGQVYAGVCSSAFGDLSFIEVNLIQEIVDEIGRPVVVVSDAAVLAF